MDVRVTNTLIKNVHLRYHLCLGDQDDVAGKKVVFISSGAGSKKNSKKPNWNYKGKRELPINIHTVNKHLCVHELDLTDIDLSINQKKILP
jgi:hypothetical protein